MKCIKFIFLFLIVLNINSFGFQLEQLMKKGNEAFQNEQYNEAIKAYKSILDQGYVSPALYFNIGNSYFRINNIGKAILYFEKALKIDPNDEDAEYNLAIAKSRTIDKIQNVPELFIVSWWKSLLSIFSAGEWAFVFLFFYLVFFVILGFWFFSHNYAVKTKLFFIGSINLIVLIISGILLFSSISVENDNNFGILTESIYTAKVSPTDKSGDAFVIHEGVKFYMKDKLDDWTEIKLDDGKVGWIKNSSFEKI